MRLVKSHNNYHLVNGTLSYSTFAYFLMLAIHFSGVTLSVDYNISWRGVLQQHKPKAKYETVCNLNILSNFLTPIL